MNESRARGTARGRDNWTKFKKFHAGSLRQSLAFLDRVILGRLLKN